MHPRRRANVRVEIPSAPVKLRSVADPSCDLESVLDKARSVPSRSQGGGSQIEPSPWGQTKPSFQIPVEGERPSRRPSIDIEAEDKDMTVPFGQPYTIAPTLFHSGIVCARHPPASPGAGNRRVPALLTDTLLRRVNQTHKRSSSEVQSSKSAFKRSSSSQTCAACCRSSSSSAGE